MSTELHTLPPGSEMLSHPLVWREPDGVLKRISIEGQSVVMEEIAPTGDEPEPRILARKDEEHGGAGQNAREMRSMLVERGIAPGAIRWRSVRGADGITTIAEWD